MQLFGLVNTMLAHDRTTAERDLSIARYAVIPLSPNSGALSTSQAVCSSYYAPVLKLAPATDSLSRAHCQR